MDQGQSGAKDCGTYSLSTTPGRSSKQERASHTAKAESETSHTDSSQPQISTSILNRPSRAPNLAHLGDTNTSLSSLMLETQTGELPSMQSGEQTQIRSAAASAILTRRTSIVMKQTIDGYELTSEGEVEPVQCRSWPQARRVLERLGVPPHKIDEISSQLSEGTEVVVRRRV